MQYTQVGAASVVATAMARDSSVLGTYGMRNFDDASTHDDNPYILIQTPEED